MNDREQRVPVLDTQPGRAQGAADVVGHGHVPEDQPDP